MINSSRTIEKINFDEVNYFYKNPKALVDYSLVQSFSLIASCLEIFEYYGINDFSASDVRDFFEKLQIIRKESKSVFVPSPKKIDSVFECLLDKNYLSYTSGIYHLSKKEFNGYACEIDYAKQTGRIL